MNPFQPEGITYLPSLKMKFVFVPIERSQATVWGERMRLSEICEVAFVIILVTILLIPGISAQNVSNSTAPMIIPFSVNVGSGHPNAMALKSSENMATNLFPTSLPSNISGIQWQDLLGGSYGETLSSIQQTPDGGYIACGGTGSPAGDGNVLYNHGFVDVWVVKLDTTGNITWQRSYGGSNYDQAFSIQTTSDGGYIFAGTTNSSNSGDVGQGYGGMDAWIVKLDSTGNIQWQNVLGGSKDDEAYSIRQTSDGGYIFAGVTNATMDESVGGVSLASHPFSGGEAWIVKLDSSGNPIWQQVYPGPGYGDTIAHSIVQTSDGGYIFAGTMYLDNDPNIGTKYGLTDIWVVKLDPTGNIQWSKLLGGDGWDFTSFWTDDTIQQTTDGGYVVIGSTTSDSEGDVGSNHGSGDVWVVKLDSTGNITWQNPLGGTDTDLGMSINQTPDNGYVFAGVTYSNDTGDVGPSYGNGDYWVGKLDPNGTIQWQLPLGGSAYDQAESIQPTSDGGYIVSGRSYSNESGVVVEQNHGDSDAWVVKLTPRFVINVTDYDTGASIPNANVDLYDYQYNNWSNQTTSGGPVAFNGSVGSNPFDFTDGSVFGLSVTADGYPTLSENVTFQITDQTVNVVLTSYTRTTIGTTYSITNNLVNLTPPYGPGDQINAGIINNVKSELSKWTLIDSGDTGNGLSGPEITKYFFGGSSPTEPSTGTTINDATFLWHEGHGVYYQGGTNHSVVAIGLYTINSSNSNLEGDQIFPTDIQNKWGGNNKWAVFESCLILSDPDWGHVLGTSHGIFGFTTETYPSATLPTKFFKYAKSGDTLYDSWYYATQDTYRGEKVGIVIENSSGYYDVDSIKGNITAATMFKTSNQRDNDHLPGLGLYIAPDGDPKNTNFTYSSWDTGSGMGETP